MAKLRGGQLRTFSAEYLEARIADADTLLRYGEIKVTRGQMDARSVQTLRWLRQQLEADLRAVRDAGRPLSAEELRAPRGTS